MNEVRVGVMPAEIRQRLAVDDRPRRRAETALQNLLGVGPGDGAHCVEAHSEPISQPRADALEIEEQFHERCIVGDRIDDFDRHRTDCLHADPLEVDLPGPHASVFAESAAFLKDSLGDVGRRRPAVRDIVLYAEVTFRAAGIVAGGEDDAATRLLEPDQVRCSGRGKDTALSDNDAAVAVGSRHLQDRADRRAIVVAPVAAENEDGAGLRRNGIEDRLDEVLQIAGRFEDPDLLPKPRGARPLVVEGRSRDPLDVHVLPHGPLDALF